MMRPHPALEAINMLASVVVRMKGEANQGED
jgi:hypothetical protein